MKNKKELRQEMKKKLSEISLEQIGKYSDEVFEGLKKYVSQFEVWFVYLAMKREVQTQKIIEFLWEKGKTVLAPQVGENNKMLAVVFEKKSVLIKNKFGIWEIEGGEVWENKIEVALVPGLAFTEKGVRLGRGMGYYDRFLAKNKGIFKIGVCFPEQIVERVSEDGRDVRMDLLSFY